MKAPSPGAVARFGSFCCCLLVSLTTVRAGSATWNLNPTSSDWNTAINWTPTTVPNGILDTATFGVSDITAISTSFYTAVGGMAFQPGASAYTFTALSSAGLHFYGTGITNNSGVAQTFLNIGSHYDFTFNGPDTTTAGTNTFFNGGVVFEFYSSAGSGTFTAPAGTVSGEFGKQVLFFDHGSAANGTFYINGSAFTDPNTSGIIAFESSSNAANAVIILGPGVNGGVGGRMVFFDGGTGGTARVQLLENSYIDAANDNLSLLPLGSLEGNGHVILGAVNLNLGTNNLSTTFSGVIEDGLFGSGGAITKTGSGTLTLSGANTFTGGTKVDGGALFLNNRTGSATGTESVLVKSGTIGGRGIISGSVAMGSGRGAGAFLAPSGTGKPSTLTIQSALTFQADGSYNCKLNAKRGVADEVVANGVTINSGAQFNLVVAGNRRLSAGQVFVLISNSAATPISGTFADLGDGAILTIGRNSFQANYEGGDGNDLTLTVVP